MRVCVHVQAAAREANTKLEAATQAQQQLQQQLDSSKQQLESAKAEVEQLQQQLEREKADQVSCLFTAVIDVPVRP